MDGKTALRTLSVADIAQIYGLGRLTVYRAVWSGKLRVRRVGRRVLVRLADAEAWIGGSKNNVRS